MIIMYYWCSLLSLYAFNAIALSFSAAIGPVCSTSRNKYESGLHNNKCGSSYSNNSPTLNTCINNYTNRNKYTTLPCNYILNMYYTCTTLTIILSESITVSNLCAIVNTVQFVNWSLITCCIIASVLYGRRRERERERERERDRREEETRGRERERKKESREGETGGRERQERKSSYNH